MHLDSIGDGQYWVHSSRRKENYQFPKNSRPVVGPIQHHIKWVPYLHRGYSGRRVKLTNELLGAPKLRMSGFILHIFLYDSIERSGTVDNWLNIY